MIAMKFDVAVDEEFPQPDGDLPVIFDGIAECVDQILANVRGCKKLTLVLEGSLFDLSEESRQALFSDVAIRVGEAIDGSLKALQEVLKLCGFHLNIRLIIACIHLIYN